LQSKRLYPDELEWDEDVLVDYVVAFRRLHLDDEERGTVSTSRQFHFGVASHYKALVSGVPQYRSVTSYEEHNNIPVYYRLYNSRTVPSRQSFLSRHARAMPTLSAMSGAGSSRRRSSAQPWRRSLKDAVRRWTTSDRPYPIPSPRPSMRPGGV
jgi:hypothetical protein